jgi:hypothetical protein
MRSNTFSLDRKPTTSSENQNNDRGFVNEYTGGTKNLRALQPF